MCNERETVSRPTSLMEQILSPESLQRMMSVGGGALVLGLIGWLWSIGVFDNPKVVAVVLGGVNLAVLAAGIALVRFTRHQLAGNGLTLLASLAMPLNLWFYDAQGLITIENGGHLWVPAAICCAIYASVARVLRNPMFVYAFVGGIVMTGLLYLADQTVGRFWELMPQVTYLVSVGWTCIYCERLFAAGDGAFSRTQFGRAFFRSGIAILLSGLTMLLGGQALAAVAEVWNWSYVPAIGVAQDQKIWALCLLTASAAAFAGEYFMRRSSRFLSLAVGTTIWSCFILLDVLQFSLHFSHFAIVTAAIIVARNFVFRRGHKSRYGWANAVLVGLTWTQFIASYFWPTDLPAMVTSGGVLGLQMMAVAVACWSSWYRDRDGFLWGLFPNRMFSKLALQMAVMALVVWALALGISNAHVLAGVSLVLPMALAIVVGRNDQHAEWQYGAIRNSSTPVVSAVMVNFLLVMGGVATSATPLFWGWFLLVAGGVLFAASVGPFSAQRALAYLSVGGGLTQLASVIGLQADYGFVLAANAMGAAVAVYAALRRPMCPPSSEAEVDSPRRGPAALELQANIFGAGRLRVWPAVDRFTFYRG